MLETKAACVTRLENDFAEPEPLDWFYNDKSMSRSRRLFEAIGRRLLGRGLLEKIEDVFFLGREEMLAADRGDLSQRQTNVRVCRDLSGVGNTVDGNTGIVPIHD